MLVGVGIGLERGRIFGPQSVSTLLMACMMQSTSTTWAHIGPWHPQLKPEHALIGAPPSAMRTILMISSMVTVPSASQSPTHGVGPGSGVGVGVDTVAPCEHSTIVTAMAPRGGRPRAVNADAKHAPFVSLRWVKALQSNGCPVTENGPTVSPSSPSALFTCAVAVPVTNMLVPAMPRTAAGSSSVQNRPSLP